MLRKLLPLALLALSPVITRAQGENIYMLEYSIAVPVGDLRDFINDPSFRGFNFGYRNMVDNNVALGVDIGWQTFFEKKNLATYYDGTAALTGTQYRYTNCFTASMQADYVWGDGKDLRPFIGAGLGTFYCRRTLDMGLYRLEKRPWQFLIQPEAGISLYLANGNALILSTNFYWGMKTKELESQSFVGFGLTYAFSD